MPSSRCKEMDPRDFLTLCVCLLLVISPVSGASNAVRHITCNAGIYAPGEIAAVVCNLHANMTSSKLNLTISRYSLNDETDLGRDIVVCKWRESTKRHDCEVAKGYNFTYIRTDHPQVTIPSVNQSFVGLYKCTNLPPEGTRSHVCEVIVQADIHAMSTLSKREQDTTCTHWIIPLVFLILVVTGVIGYVIWRHREKSRRKKTTGGTQGVVYSSLALNQQQDEQVESATPFRLNEKVEKFLQGFCLTDEIVDDVTKSVEKHIHDRRTKFDQEATVKFSRQDVRSLTNETGEDGIVVVGFSSSVLTIVLVPSEGQTGSTKKQKVYPIPDDVKLKTAIQMFEFIADSINNFATANLKGRKLIVWFIVSFSCQHESLTNVRLIKWTKEFRCKGKMKLNLVSLLKEAMQKINKDLDLDLKLIVNNIVATLVCASLTNEACLISLVASNGFNACYLEERGEWLSGDAGKDTVIVNTELGALGESGCLNELKTEFDTEVDTHSMQRGQQIMEKMIGRIYIAEIVKFALRKLINEGLLFSSASKDCTLCDSQAKFSPDFVSLIESDDDEDFITTKYVLKQLHVENYTKEDCQVVRLVCRRVSERAAVLASCAVAALIRYMKLESEVTVVVDGCLYQNHRCFRNRLCRELKKKVRTGVQVISSFSGNDKGIAIADSVVALTSRK